MFSVSVVSPRLVLSFSVVRLAEQEKTGSPESARVGTQPALVLPAAAMRAFCCLDQFRPVQNNCLPLGMFEIRRGWLDLFLPSFFGHSSRDRSICV